MASQSNARRLKEAEAFLASAIAQCEERFGLAPSAFLVALASIPDDSGGFSKGRAPFLFRFRGHPALNQRMAEWVAEQLEVSEVDETEEEAE